jgi:hypothetical protein
MVIGYIIICSNSYNEIVTSRELCFYILQCIHYYFNTSLPLVIDHAERLPYILQSWASGRVTFESWQTGKLRAEPDSVVRWKCAGSLLQLRPSPPEQSFYFYSVSSPWNIISYFSCAIIMAALAGHHLVHSL